MASNQTTPEALVSCYRSSQIIVRDVLVLKSGHVENGCTNRPGELVFAKSKESNGPKGVFSSPLLEF